MTHTDTSKTSIIHDSHNDGIKCVVAFSSVDEDDFSLVREPLLSPTDWSSRTMRKIVAEGSKPLDDRVKAPVHTASNVSGNAESKYLEAVKLWDAKVRDHMQAHQTSGIKQDVAHVSDITCHTSYITYHILEDTYQILDIRY